MTEKLTQEQSLNGLDILAARAVAALAGGEIEPLDNTTRSDDDPSKAIKRREMRIIHRGYKAAVKNHAQRLGIKRG